MLAVLLLVLNNGITIMFMRLNSLSNATTSRTVTMPISITHYYSTCLTKHTSSPNSNGYATYNTYSGTFDIKESSGGNAAWRILIIGY